MIRKTLATLLFAGLAAFAGVKKADAFVDEEPKPSYCEGKNFSVDAELPDFGSIYLSVGGNGARIDFNGKENEVRLYDYDCDKDIDEIYNSLKGHCVPKHKIKKNSLFQDACTEEELAKARIIFSDFYDDMAKVKEAMWTRDDMGIDSILNEAFLLDKDTSYVLDLDHNEFEVHAKTEKGEAILVYDSEYPLPGPSELYGRVDMLILDFLVPIINDLHYSDRIVIYDLDWNGKIDKVYHTGLDMCYDNPLDYGYDEDDYPVCPPGIMKKGQEIFDYYKDIFDYSEHYLKTIGNPSGIDSLLEKIEPEALEKTKKDFPKEEENMCGDFSHRTVTSTGDGWKLYAYINDWGNENTFKFIVNGSVEFIDEGCNGSVDLIEEYGKMCSREWDKWNSKCDEAKLNDAQQVYSYHLYVTTAFLDKMDELGNSPPETFMDEAFKLEGKPDYEVEFSYNGFKVSEETEDSGIVFNHSPRFMADLLEVGYKLVVNEYTTTDGMIKIMDGGPDGKVDQVYNTLRGICFRKKDGPSDIKCPKEILEAAQEFFDYYKDRYDYAVNVEGMKAWSNDSFLYGVEELYW